MVAICSAKVRTKAGKILQRTVLNEVARILPDLSLHATPPEIAHIICGIVRRVTHHNDPYQKIRRQSNIFALMMYPELCSRVSSSEDRLMKAVEIAIAGNIIDYGVKSSLNIKKELGKLLLTKKHISGKDNNLFIHYHDFKCMVRDARNILYLADNAGETVFGKILIEEIRKRDAYRNIIYAVKETPLLMMP
jgi:uncharacterized protein with ATP-grasp and redox domains